MAIFLTSAAFLVSEGAEHKGSSRLLPGSIGRSMIHVGDEEA
jgi:hypothetical protein